jgi:hypothetical protein
MGINDMFKGIRRDIGRKIGGDRDYEESRYRERDDDDDEERDYRSRDND